MIKKDILLLIAILTLNSGCATVILDNEKTLNPLMPDQAIFPNPICLKLIFKREDIGFFNEQAELLEMNPQEVIRRTLGLPYYNILVKCENPLATYTVVYRSKTRNWWAKSPWVVLSMVTLGIIPAYLNDIGTISVYSEGNLLVESELSKKKIISLFMFPKWIADNSKTVELYKLNTDLATKARELAKVLKEAIENKALQNKK